SRIRLLSTKKVMWFGNIPDIFRVMKRYCTINCLNFPNKLMSKKNSNVAFRLSIRLLFFIVSIGLFCYPLQAQERRGIISGGFQSDTQIYRDDDKIETVKPDEQIGSNNYLKLDYTLGEFAVGLRYEAYLPPLLGYPTSLEGRGIANRYASYTTDLLTVTVGNFYEQFGSGLILRAYEERLLGIDNSLDGINVRLNPLDGIRLTLLAGKQRSTSFDVGDGTIRGIDGVFGINDLLKIESNINLQLEGSLVSKFETYTGPDPDIEEVVNAYSGRMYFNSSIFDMSAEYVEKDPDPNQNNFFDTDRRGRALLTTLSTVKKGIGFSWTFRTIDNMDFRSERNASLTNLWVNYIPAETRQHGYLLPNIYPYAVQLNGEIGNQFNLSYFIPKKTMLGGKYGTRLALNYARFNKLDRSGISEEDARFDSNFLSFGDTTLYRDFNIEIERRLSKKVKLVLDFVAINYNRSEIEGVPSENVKSYIGVIEMQYKMQNRKSLRMELQHLSTKQGDGNWAGLVAEYSLAPRWSFFFFDQYNYGDEEQVHYYQVGFSYTERASRLALNYGRQRGGLICVGGVCRNMPAASGFFLSLTTSFVK
ncbi:MAG: DUF6029 family protein, partial [Cyclobacteriaceae bacterium]